MLIRDLSCYTVLQFEQHTKILCGSIGISSCIDLINIYHNFLKLHSYVPSVFIYHRNVLRFNKFQFCLENIPFFVGYVKAVRMPCSYQTPCLFLQLMDVQNLKHRLSSFKQSLPFQISASEAGCFSPSQMKPLGYRSVTEF